MRRSTEDVPDPVGTWCVGTDDGRRYVLDYAGNGGFGPVTVWSDGRLVPAVWRHRFQRGVSQCPVCVDPTLATTYLPPIRWETVDPLVTAEPGSGHPDRGVFEAVFRGGPGNTRIRADVFRRDWWHTWRHYAAVQFDPRGDWRCAFTTWRQSTTGYVANTSSNLAICADIAL